MTLRSLVVWCGFVVLAVINGGFRDAVLTPRLGEHESHVIGTITLCTAILIVTWLTINWMRPAKSTDALLIGGGWGLMTVAFEFLVGHYVFGTSWGKAVVRLRSRRRSNLASGSRHGGACSPRYGAGEQLIVKVSPCRPCSAVRPTRRSPWNTAPALKPPLHTFVREVDLTAEHERTASDDVVETT